MAGRPLMKQVCMRPASSVAYAVLFVAHCQEALRVRSNCIHLDPHPSNSDYPLCSDYGYRGRVVHTISYQQQLCADEGHWILYDRSQLPSAVVTHGVLLHTSCH